MNRRTFLRSLSGAAGAATAGALTAVGAAAIAAPAPRAARALYNLELPDGADQVAVLEPPPPGSVLVLRGHLSRAALEGFAIGMRKIPGWRDVKVMVLTPDADVATMPARWLERALRQVRDIRRRS